MSDERYMIISADCHGGGNITDYRPYLTSRWHEQFDQWAAAYEIPYEDMKGPDGDRNWDSDRRLKELEADGIVAEVIYPNTVPPFFPKASLADQPPAANAGDLTALRPHAERINVTPATLGQTDDAANVARWAGHREVGRHWLTGHDFPLAPVAS